MIHLNLINHHTGVICNRCHEEILGLTKRQIHRKRRRFFEEEWSTYFGPRMKWYQDVFYILTKQFCFRFPGYRIYLSIMRKE